MKTSDTNTYISSDTPTLDPSVQAVLRALDAQTGQFSVATQMRLNEARARAIAATRVKIPFWRSTPMLAAAFAVSAAYTFVLLTQPQGMPTSAELEATALFEATFGAEVADEAAANSAAFFDASAVEASGLNETALDETVVANDLEFYAWLSETSAERAAPANTPTGSGS